MSQLSRPYQIALAAMACLALVWVVALRGHNSNPESTPAVSAPTPAAASAAASQAQSAAAPSSVYHGKAAGVEGLTRAINKAHGAVATSQQNAKELQSKSAQASGEAASASPGEAASATTHASAGAASTAPSSGSQSAATASKNAAGTPSKSSAGASAKSAANNRQAVLQHELKRGKVAVLMFWDPKSSDDQAVRTELHNLSRRNGRIAVHLALPREVVDFGNFTQDVQVLQTPTVMVIDGKGQVSTLTGLSDARTIQQTIGNALQGGAGKVLGPKFTAWVHGSSRGKFIGKVEAMCKHKRFYLATTKKQFAADLSKIVTTGSGFKAKVVGLAPVADRAYIARMTDLALRGLQNLRSAFSTGNAWKARTFLFEGQQRLDQAYDGYQRYGINNCVELSG
jgi:hypothetical protein